MVHRGRSHRGPEDDFGGEAVNAIAKIDGKLIHPEVVKMQVAVLLHQFPELAEDQEALLLSLDSETDAIALMTHLVKRIQETKAQASALDAYVSDLRGRGDMLDRRVEGMRALATKIMETAGLLKLDLTVASVCIRPGTKRVIITDEHAVPDSLCRFKREPDKIKLKEELESGTAIDGAYLSNGEPALAIRVK